MEPRPPTSCHTFFIRRRGHAHSSCLTTEEDEQRGGGGGREARKKEEEELQRKRDERLSRKQRRRRRGRRGGFWEICWANGGLLQRRSRTAGGAAHPAQLQQQETEKKRGRRNQPIREGRQRRQTERIRSRPLQILFPQCLAPPSVGSGESELQPIKSTHPLIRPMAFLWPHDSSHPLLQSQSFPPLALLLLLLEPRPHAEDVSCYRQNNYGVSSGRSQLESPEALKGQDGPAQSEQRPLLHANINAKPNFFCSATAETTGQSQLLETQLPTATPPAPPHVFYQ